MRTKRDPRTPGRETTPTDLKIGADLQQRCISNQHLYGGMGSDTCSPDALEQPGPATEHRFGWTPAVTPSA